MRVADTSPPTVITAGDSQEWEMTFSDYSAVSYDAELVFQRPGSERLKLTGVADGAAFDFTLTAEESAAMDAGQWTWAVRVMQQSGSTVKTVAIGETQVKPDPIAEPDPTRNERILALLEARIEERAFDVQESISVLGQDISKTDIGTILDWRERYQAMVNRERWKRHYDITGNRRRRGRIYLRA